MEEDNLKLDLSENYVEVPISNESTKQTKKSNKQVKQTAAPVEEDKLINCLRNERVIVRFIKKASPLIPNNNDKDHIAHGGMIEGGTRTFSLPKLTSGVFKNCLTDSEKDYLEYALGLEPNALSVYNKKDNFWVTGSGNAEISLGKEDTILDLSNPHEYIIYKMLRACSDRICPSLTEFQSNKKATYEYVMINEHDEADVADQEMTITARCYMEFGKYKDNADVLRTILETLEKKELSEDTKIEFLRQQINNEIKMNAKLFLSIITDPYLETKVLIKRACKNGILSKRGQYYYVMQDNSPLCNSGEDPTLDNAAKFLASPKRQDLLLKIQAKLNQ